MIMMRTATFAVVLAAVSCGAQAAVDVGTCEEFAAVDRKTETEVTITNANFACTEYTRLSIRSAMVLKSSVGAITFSNLALAVYGSLTVEPDVEFTGIELVEKHGGALRTILGSSTVFQGTATFTDISIKTTDLGDGNERKRKGGAIYNKGDMVFMDDATFTGNLNDNLEYGSGPGGALANHVKGTMHFMGNLNMVDNEADDYFGGAEGGAIFNRGDIIVDGDALFDENYSGRGAAIYQEKWATFVISGFATFTKNKCIDTYGGAIANIGGDITFLGGSLFDDNFAENSGDGGVGGAIYNYDGGIVTLEGSTTFHFNYGNWGGAIFNQAFDSNPYYTEDDETFKVPVITYPDDTVFDANYGQYCNDVAYAYDEETCGL